MSLGIFLFYNTKNNVKGCLEVRQKKKNKKFIMHKILTMVAHVYTFVFYTMAYKKFYSLQIYSKTNKKTTQWKRRGEIVDLGNWWSITSAVKLKAFSIKFIKLPVNHEHK